ncbi:methyl-accepting chemotaxis protein [Paenibacillus chartarius]|uniref:Methyl-accepting chemotaxis protein n=1 Tax=Paenibacillus chartarius TaxID=747481 RepID=A0ABV6DM49_9BACL
MAKLKSAWRLTIRSKLMLSMLILMIYPALAVGGMSYKQAVAESDELIRSNLRNSVKMAVELARMFEEAEKSGTMSREAAQEEVKKALLGVKGADGKRPINTNIDLGENGYFFILNDKGDELAHPSIEGQNIMNEKTSDGRLFVKELIDNGKQAEGGFTFYDWPLPNSSEEALKITYSLSTPQWGWIICAGSYMQDYNTGADRIFQTVLTTIIICLVLGGIIATLFAQHISGPIKKLSRQAKQFATGDLSTADFKVKNKDEIRDLYVSFEAMYTNLKQLASGLLSSSDTLAQASGELSQAIGETTEAVTQISQAVQQAATSNETQARSIQESAKSMEEMAGGIQRVATTSSTAYEASVMTLKEAEQGNALIEQSSEQMGNVNATVGDLASIVGKLGERSQQIGDIVQVITDISSQTNLLALNASIEAARAGEQGKGFAVVAGEVRKLAERSNESAMQVAELIEAIRSDIEVATKAMHRGEQEVEAGVESIRSTGEAFQRILEATRSVVDQVQEASAAAEQMSASSQQVAASLLEMESMSSLSNDMMHTVSASTEEQLASMEEIAASSESLSRMSEEMQKLAHRFKL